MILVLRLRILAHYMSERITIVVPDGTKKRLKDEANNQRRKSGNLAMKYVLDGLSGLSVTLKGGDLVTAINRSK